MPLHKRTPASQSLSSLTFTPCIQPSQATPSPVSPTSPFSSTGFPSSSSSSSSSRRLPVTRSTSPLLPRRLTDQGPNSSRLHPDSAAGHLHPGVRVKRSCSTSALSSLSISSTISDSPCIRNITQKSTIVEPTLDYATSDYGSMSSRSRSTSASTLNDQLFGHHAPAFLSRRSMTVSTSASSTSTGQKSDYDLHHHNNDVGDTPVLSPTSPSSPTITPDASTPSTPVKRGRSHTSASSSYQLSQKGMPSDCLRHVASLGKLFSSYPPPAAAASESPLQPSRRFSLQPIQSMSPEPVAEDYSVPPTPLTPDTPFIKQITVSYPTERSCDRQCKRLFLALEHLQKSSSTPSTPTSAKKAKRASIDSLTTFEHKHYLPPTFRCSARLINEGKCRVDVTYSNGHVIHLHPEGCTYDELLGKLGLEAHLSSSAKKP